MNKSREIRKLFREKFPDSKLTYWRKLRKSNIRVLTLTPEYSRFKESLKCQD